jgi:hypothetical protein
MERDPEAFLMDVVDAADAISDAVRDIDLDEYRRNRLIRSSVEREFIIIGEALSQLSRADAKLFAQVDDAQRIISFRNKITHEYIKVDDALVWGFIEKYLKPLRTLCWRLVEKPNQA